MCRGVVYGVDEVQQMEEEAAARAAQTNTVCLRVLLFVIPLSVPKRSKFMLREIWPIQVNPW